MKHKVLIFSHKSDNDGITPVILSKLVFSEVDYILEEPSTIDDSFKKEYEAGTFNRYDFIFVTDLCISKELAEKIEQDEKNKNKILVFDHHHTRLEMNAYSFITVVSEQNGKKECASSLYYQFLLEHYSNEVLKKEVVSSMVELVRLLDTWTWKEENIVEAKWLGNLFDIYGREYYMEYYQKFCLNEDKFFFCEAQRYLLEVEEVRIQNYISKKEKEIYSVVLHGYRVGVVFAEFYRSELGNTLANKYQEKYDFFVVINISRSVSYRGVKEIDLGSFASIYGGAGHQKAAGSSLPKHLLENIIQMIFEDARIEKENDKNED